MTDHITVRNQHYAQAIEAGALAAVNCRRADNGLPPLESLEILTPGDQSEWRADAEATIRAAMPHIRQAILTEVDHALDQTPTLGLTLPRAMKTQREAMREAIRGQG